MRKVQFNVPSEVMAEFAQEMANRDLSNTIIGATDDNETIVEIAFDKAESGEVDELEEILDNLCEELGDEDDDENDEDDES